MEQLQKLTVCSGYLPLILYLGTLRNSHSRYHANNAQAIPTASHDRRSFGAHLFKSSDLFSILTNPRLFSPLA
jgi:hypothetical protein